MDKTEFKASFKSTDNNTYHIFYGTEEDSSYSFSLEADGGENGGRFIKMYISEDETADEEILNQVPVQAEHRLYSDLIVRTCKIADEITDVHIERFFIHNSSMGRVLLRQLSELKEASTHREVEHMDKA